MRDSQYAWRITRVRYAFYGDQKDQGSVEELCKAATDESKTRHVVKTVGGRLYIAVDPVDWKKEPTRLLTVPCGEYVVWDGRRMDVMDTGSFLADHTLSDPRLKEVIR